MRFPEKLTTLEPYIPTCGTPRFCLDANESFLTPPERITEKLYDALRAVTLNRYPDSSTRELSLAAASYYGVAPEQIVASNGSDEMISILMNSFLNKNDTVLIAEPDFSMYGFYAHTAELNVKKVEKNAFKLSPDDIISAARGANMLIFSNPCNPTGQGLTRDEILQIVTETDCLCVIDEAYMEFWDESVIGKTAELDNLIVLRTASKAIGLASARLGFSISNAATAQLIKNVKSPFNVNSFTQAAGIVLLEEREYIKSAIGRIKESKSELFSLLSAVNPIDTVTNFVLVKTPLAGTIRSVLSESGIAVRKIMGDYLRITAGGAVANAETADVIIKQIVRSEG